MDLDAFGRLPIMFEGRIKPIDTLARNSLRDHLGSAGVPGREREERSRPCAGCWT